MNWNIQYMWLSGNQHPSFSTINRFRSEHMKDCVSSLFIQELKINDPFRMENMYYNWKDDYYVCPMEQHMEHVGHKKSVSDNGYASWIDTYRAQRCEGCPLRGQCFKGKGNRTINVNHQLKRYKKKAFERLTSERGLFHRSKRPVEPEAVFGQIKTDKQYKRFRHRGFSKIQMDFGILAMAFNLKNSSKMWGRIRLGP